MKRVCIFIMLISLFVLSIKINAQDPDDERLKLSGEFLSDERFLLTDPYDWAWNETRLTLGLDKKITDNSKFHSEIWLRNIGLPGISSAADLYNKGIVDPYNLEIREAYVQIYGFLTKNLDLSIGRQHIAWGTADKLNPTANLNPYDMEDILDFGRQRGSDAINLNYYINNDFSLQGVFIPFFQPANMPVGIFSDALNPETELPDGMVLHEYSDKIIMPRYNLRESSIAGFKFKGFASGVDFSVSYVWGLDGLPFNTRNTIIPVDTIGGININSELTFARNHIIGADMAAGLGGVGLWAEAALIIPEHEVITANDYSAFFPDRETMIRNNIVLYKEPYLKYIVGGDYFFADGSYFNLQYMHGFMLERGTDNLNDYFFFQFEKKFLNDKLTVAPIGGAFIIAYWNEIKKNYALIYMPSVKYQATPNTEISLSTALFEGAGDNVFANLKEYNMFMFKMKYSF
ncbi:MAG: hypothetical protein JXB49_09995 [Bacteroidales bacterium]|nr:hypothetical protein [Bacteroidales bacterium]